MKISLFLINEKSFSVKCDNTLMAWHFCEIGLEKIWSEMVFNSENLPLLHNVMSQTFLIYQNTDDYWLADTEIFVRKIWNEI